MVCYACKGTGKLLSYKRTPSGKKCPYCQGTGKVEVSPTIGKEKAAGAS